MLLHRIREDSASNDDILKFIFSQFMRNPLIKLFHLSNLSQMLNGHRMVDVEFFGNFSCSFQRMSFNNGSQLLLTSDGWPLSFSPSRLSSLLPNFLNHYCTIHSLAVASYLCCFMNHFELKLKKMLEFAFF